MLASELLGSKWLDEHKDIDITGIAYDSRNVLPGNIFVCIKGFETDGHKYAEMAVKNGKATRPSLHCGICGEHGGDPTSVEFCHKIGLDYVSCSPFRVPIARLAAAQAAIAEMND